MCTCVVAGDFIFARADGPDLTETELKAMEGFIKAEIVPAKASDNAAKEEATNKMKQEAFDVLLIRYCKDRHLAVRLEFQAR